MVEEGAERLIRRAASGDRDAAGEVARRYEAHVRAHIHRRLGPGLRRRTDTEDLLQSTFAAVLPDLTGLEYRGEEAFKAWLSAAAERQILMKARFHRAGRRDLRREMRLASEEGPALELTSPSQGAVREELRASLRDAISRLPERERRVVELHSIEGLTFEAVAKEVGLADRSSAYRIFERALRKVGKLLDREG
ncbi:MAG: RNA polymerase sigma factor [Planctomycetota bacterium]|jgi:RNA polymerase sigma factor (sigma-70 family)